MDHANESSSNSNKRRLARTFAKVMHIRAMSRNSPADRAEEAKNQSDQEVPKTKLHGTVRHDRRNTDLKSVFDEDEKAQKKASNEAFLAKLFASVSAIKSAYAQMQFAESPYDGEGIESADEIVVAELKILSEQKQCYLKNHLDDPSPETTQVLAEIKEQKSLLKTFEIMGKKLDSELKLKHSELVFLREKLRQADKENKVIEKRLNMSGSSSTHDNLCLNTLSPAHFIRALAKTVRSTRRYVRLIINEMESVGWDLDVAADSIEPGVVYPSASHKCFTFESYVCRQMFDGFNHPFFSNSHKSLPENQGQQEFFSRYVGLKSQKPKEYLVSKPKSAFAKFCRKKYLRLVHPKMEESLFGNLDQRNLLVSGSQPETDFYAMFCEMAKQVWQLHCLAFSFQPEASIFQVSKTSRFSEVYMDCVNEEAFLSSGANPRVAFTVVPGFKIGKTIIQSQVYLS
ncbi:hypothetical protein DCAR_0312163 [Daucus carota subsp. sativus]|uniref:Uncharacterized protein n=1 Tax=Daucus carota subsp. sativus TaxID=79200 RepID=A0A161WTE6_DAUCS|nr:PREDICTED: IRK-interacting protein-like [Daucus carota subsp. sativus]WOG92886.1 hypothetical protein DCAR_0312163 [Daucus carota subsp. sativus]